MGAIRQFTPVKLFIGILAADTKFIPLIEERLMRVYGSIDHRSDVIPFDFTKYYEAEMGDIIDRVFFSFERLIEADGEGRVTAARVGESSQRNVTM